MTKVMLVEDDNNLREIYEARLQAEGYQIVSARDGEEALVVAKAEKPDLIISDVMMPKISGFEMLDILRNTDGLKEVKVIMLTALGQSDDQQRADRLGADRYLVKSQVTLEDIVRVAHELLGDKGSGGAAAGPTDTPPANPDPAPPAGPPTEPPASSDPSPPAAPPADPAPADPVAAGPSATSIPVTTAAAEPANETAQPAAQEEADVEAKIEDFVAGATDSPDAPANATPLPSNPTPAEPPMPESSEPMPAVSAPPVPEATETVASEVKANDDKLVTEAAEALTVEAAPEEDKPSGEPKPINSDAKPEPKKVGGERVIQPIASEPKKDIETLLAVEEAKEAGTTPAAEPKVVIGGSNEPAATPSPAKGSGPAVSAPGTQVDPNSIAL